MDYEKKWEELCPQYEGVLSGFGGLMWHRYVKLFMNLLNFATSDQSLEDLWMPNVLYTWVPEVDTQNFLAPCKYNPKILIPTVERSIVLYRKYEDYTLYFGIGGEDDYLMYAMQHYRAIHGEEIGELLKVADFYHCRDEIMECWEISKNWVCPNNK